ncbi:hypothetical protein Tco_0169180 [Tanacetum coccineum]
MVACLEIIDGNDEFHQIVEFLTTSSIHYALTVSPTIYASYIEQFWSTAKSKTVNDVKQIHVTVDGKTVVISESSVRSDLHFNDEDGRVTPLLASMLVPQVVKGEGSGQPSEPQPPSSTASPSQSSGPPKKVGDEAVYTEEDDKVVRVATTATSLEAEQESGSGPRFQDTTLGDADAQTRPETASKKSHDPPLLKVNTSGSGKDSMEHQDDLTDFVPPTPHDSPLLGGHIPGSDEGRPNINELMTICTQLSNRVLALENSKTAQDLVIKKLQKKVKRLEKTQRARTPGMKLFKIGTSRRKSLDKENVSKQGRSLKTKPIFEEDDFNDDFDNNVEGDTVNVGGAVNTATTRVSAASASVTTVGVTISTAETRTPSTTTITAFEDEDLTISQILVKMRSDKAKVKGVAFRDVEEPRRSTPAPIAQPSFKDKGKPIMVEPEKPPKNPRKA